MGLAWLWAEGTMAVNLHRLRVYCVVVEELSISRAAERLEVTQPVVSRLVAGLERYYGTNLLLRRGRQVVPTDAGVTVYRYACDVLQATRETDRLVRELAAGYAGQVAVAVTTAIGSYTFPAVWQRFLLAHPRTQLVLNLVHSQRVLMEVQDRSVDLGLALLATVPQNVVAHPLGTLRMALVAAPGHPLAGRTIGPDGLVGQTLLWTNGANWAHPLEAWGIAGRCKIVQFGDTETVKRGVEVGLGLARLPQVAVERELAAGTLARVVIAGQELPADLLLLQGRTPPRSPVVNAFAEYLLRQADELRGRL
jgi:DNA-binding transcriptional LysR family regulator